VATDEEQKAELKQFVSAIHDFATWGHAEKIRMFAWLQHHLRKKERFSTGDINWCYNALSYERSNTTQYLINMEGRGELLQDKQGYRCEGKFLAKYDEKYGIHDITLNIRQKVKDVMALVPGVDEQDFMKEAEICLRHDAGRATIIMVWCVGFYHLCQFILKHHLSAFNAAFPKHYPGLYKDAKVKVMHVYDDFATLKEFVVIDICKRENIVNQNVAKILFEKLEKRNAAAHPSTVKIGQLQAENFIDELVENVILALPI
jgi:hypothetical protein